MTQLQKLMDALVAWSDGQFGTDDRTIGILYHLKKEVDELIDSTKKTKLLLGDDSTYVDELTDQIDKTDMEFADCFMLLLDAASHSYIDAEQLIGLSYKKMEINKNRKWGEPDENGVVEHVKTEDK